MLLSANGKISIHTLTKEEYIDNEDAISYAIDDIFASNKLLNGKGWKYSEQNFFDKHPLNTFLYAKKGDKIVGLIYGAPHRDYMCYEEYGTENIDTWGIVYLMVHKYHQRQGLGSTLFTACMEDIRNKGGKVVSSMPNRRSIYNVHNCVTSNNLGSLVVESPSRHILNVNFSQPFLDREINPIESGAIFAKPKTEPNKHELFDIYFMPEWVKYLEEHGDEFSK